MPHPRHQLPVTPPLLQGLQRRGMAGKGACHP